MDNPHISFPEQRNYEKAFELAHRLAQEKLAAIRDIERHCTLSEARLHTQDAQKIAVLPYLNQLCAISIPGAEVSEQVDGEPLTIRDKLVILHHFLTAKGTPLTGKLITFKELPEGAPYAPTFARRTIQPLLQNFGKAPENLLLFSQPIGGYKSDYGDTAITIRAFPRVPITIVIWQGDDEFPAQGNVLFDSSISDYLPTEDITILSEIITWRLVRYQRAGLGI